MRKLSTTNLELAVWIARLGSFTAAAERLHTTQPAVSARVRELEQSLGQTLFLRQGRGVEPTPEGREFVRDAERVLQQIEDLSLAFSSASAAGVVRLGTSSICMDLVAALTTRVAQRMPRVSYDVEINRAAHLLERVEARKLDLAIVSGPIDAHTFRVMSLGFDRMLWVASAAVCREWQSLAPEVRLRGLPIWCVQQASFYWSSATRGLIEQGAELDRVNAISNTLGAARIVSAGCGIGLLSESLIRRELAEGTLVPLPDLLPCEPIEFRVVCMSDSSSRILAEVMKAAVEVSPFAPGRAAEPAVDATGAVAPDEFQIPTGP